MSAPFPKPSLIPTAHAYEIHLKCDVCHWKGESGVFQFVCRCFPPSPPPPPPRPKMPFTYVVNIYSHMSLSKGHVGSRGGGKASLNKLKDTSFIFPMTNVILLGVFRKHAQKEYGKVWETKSIPILSLCYSLEYYMTVKPTDQPAFSVSKLKERLHMLF